MLIPDKAVDVVQSTETDVGPLSLYISREDTTRMLARALPHLLADYRKRLVKADKDLGDMIVDPESSRAVHLAAKADGVRLALSYLDELAR